MRAMEEAERQVAETGSQLAEAKRQVAERDAELERALELVGEAEHEAVERVAEAVRADNQPRKRLEPPAVRSVASRVFKG